MRILVLCHSDLVPSSRYRKLTKNAIDRKPWRTEAFVALALEQLGHAIEFCGVDDEVGPLRQHLRAFKPHAVFNLLEEFGGEALLEPLLVDYLRAQGTPVTGGGPTELLLTKNKIATKCLLRAGRVNTPGSSGWPKIVKFVTEESSTGLSDRGVVKNQGELQRMRRTLRRRMNSAVFAEEFISGRELHCGVIFRRGRPWLSPLLETDFGRKRGPRILTEKVKWDFAYRERVGINLKLVGDLSTAERQRVYAEIRKAVRALGLRGPARIDMRLTDKKRLYFIEVNSNPDLAEGDEFAHAFACGGVSYNRLIAMVLQSAFSKN